MAMAITLKEFLKTEGVDYDLVQHAESMNAMEAAENAHISGEMLAKGVILHDDYGYVMAVVPATHKVQIGKLRHRYQRYLSLAEESELPELFDDCEVGAVPPVGKAYDVQVIFDDKLSEYPDIYFEAGDHADLVHVSGKDFRKLMGNVPHGQISCHI